MGCGSSLLTCWFFDVSHTSASQTAKLGVQLINIITTSYNKPLRAESEKERCINPCLVGKESLSDVMWCQFYTELRWQHKVVTPHWSAQRWCHLHCLQIFCLVWTGDWHNYKIRSEQSPPSSLPGHCRHHVLVFVWSRFVWHLRRVPCSLVTNIFKSQDLP